ncbi:MAG: HNH endonuclease [bacterium]|nr:HNH endonuclease [bacterium]
MARKRRRKSVDWLIRQIDAQLKSFGTERGNLTLRQKVLALCEVHENVKDLGVNVVHEHGWNACAAVERIRLYFIEHESIVLDSAEIAVVSGISDYPRRIRELRVESGYQIASGSSPDPDSGIVLKPDQYLLVDAAPDLDAARRWHAANRIRRSDVGSQKRLLQYFMENTGKVLTTEELAYVAKEAKEYARRVRELRTEQGYSVATRFTGRPDLKAGQYVLQSRERIAETHDRKIPEAVQKAVYERDSNACRVCAWNHERWNPEDPRILELHHLEHHENRGPNVESNLIVTCSKCHDEVHNGKHTSALKKIKTAL